MATAIGLTGYFGRSEQGKKSLYLEKAYQTGKQVKPL